MRTVKAISRAKHADAKTIIVPGGLFAVRSVFDKCGYTRSTTQSVDLRAARYILEGMLPVRTVNEILGNRRGPFLIQLSPKAREQRDGPATFKYNIKTADGEFLARIKAKGIVELKNDFGSTGDALVFSAKSTKAKIGAEALQPKWGNLQRINAARARMKPPKPPLESLPPRKTK